MKLIAGNWKMNPSTLAEAEGLLNKVKKEAGKIEDVEIAICPPFVYLSSLKQAMDSGHRATGELKLGGQNCFWEEKGAFTGEISPLMLKDLGCEYVILGHSERRKYLKETNEIIAQKITAATKAKLKPIFCIGETGEEKKRDKTIEVLKNQLKEALEPFSTLNSPLSNLVIAYEPVWAIGTGINCSVDEAMTILVFIKKELLKLFPEKTANRIRILYGGSANSENAKSYINAGFDGLLVGGSSLKAEEFKKMIKFCNIA